MAVRRGTDILPRSGLLERPHAVGAAPRRTHQSQPFIRRPAIRDLLVMQFRSLWRRGAGRLH